MRTSPNVIALYLMYNYSRNSLKLMSKNRMAFLKVSCPTLLETSIFVLVIEKWPWRAGRNQRPLRRL